MISTHLSYLDTADFRHHTAPGWDPDTQAYTPSATVVIEVSGATVFLKAVSPWALLDLADELHRAAVDLQQAWDERDNEPLPGLGSDIG